MCCFHLNRWDFWSHGDSTREILLPTLTTCLTNALTLHFSLKPTELLLASSLIFPRSIPHIRWDLIKFRATDYQPCCLGTPLVIRGSLSSRNTSSGSGLALFPHVDGLFPQCSAATRIHSTGTHYTGHGTVGALHSVSNPGPVERCSSRNGWITSGNNKERRHTLPLYGYSQLPAWQDSAVKWENNEISSCSLEILEIWTPGMVLI